MEITNEIKAKIMAPYIGSSCFTYDGSIGTKRSLKGITWTLALQDEKGDVFRIDKCKVLLKPISAILDEDAIELIKIYKVITSNDDGYITEHSQSIEKIKKAVIAISEKGAVLRACQYLQSKGYALPYMDYSAQDLVDLGVYKLI